MKNCFASRETQVVKVFPQADEVFPCVIDDRFKDFSSLNF